MEARERELVLILTDISGYTRFMLENQTSAVHRQLCITSLIEMMLRRSTFLILHVGVRS